MKNLILPLLLLTALLVSCTNDDRIIENKAASYDVYVAGKESNKASYWKNNVLTYLTGGDNIRAEKILVENNTTYVLGKEPSVLPPGKYYFWKNNTKYDLSQYLGFSSSTFTPEYFISDMAVDDGNDYFIGCYDTSSPIAGQRYAFCIWKNGVKTVLKTSDYYSFAWNSKLNIFNHQPYVSAGGGYYINTTFHSVPGMSYSCNFSENINGINFLYTKSMDYYYRQLSTNTDVFVGNNNLSPNLSQGKIISEKNSNDIYVIEGAYMIDNYYFKNNVKVTVPIDPDYSAIIDMFVLDNNIYMIKQRPSYPSSSPASKVYINNIESQSVTNSSNVTENEFNSIFVVKN